MYASAAEPYMTQRWAECGGSKLRNYPFTAMEAKTAAKLYSFCEDISMHSARQQSENCRLFWRDTSLFMKARATRAAETVEQQRWSGSKSTGIAGCANRLRRESRGRQTETLNVLTVDDRQSLSSKAKSLL